MLMFHKLYTRPLDMMLGHFEGLKAQKMNQRVRRNISAMNKLAFFRNALFVIAVIMPFVHYKAGITAGQLIVAEAIFALSLVLFEVPSGWIADIWTRKSAMIAGIALELLGFALMGIMDSYAMLVISQIVVAAGLSLISGTISAMLYDTLLEARLTRLYRKLEGFRHGLALYAVGASGVMSGVLFAIHPDLVIIASLITVGISFVYALFLYEPKRVKEAIHKNPIHDILVTIDLGVRKDPYIGRLVLFTACLFGVTNAAFWMQQPYYIALDISIVWFGIFGATGHLIGGLCAHFSHLLSKRLTTHMLLLLAMLWLIGIYVFSALVPGFIGIALLMSGAALYGVTFPVIQDEVNKRVSSARRATLLSCVSLCARLMFAIIAFSISGLIDQAQGVYSALLILALLLVLTALPTWVLFYRARPVAKYAK